MSILVTGSHGWIGAWVLKTLLVTGERPVAYAWSDGPWRARVLAEHGVSRIIHLAALQIPQCRHEFT